MGTGIPGQRFTYQKHGLPTAAGLAQVRLPVPRLGAAALQSRRPARQLDALARDANAATPPSPARQGLSLASRVLPLITLAHGPSASNNHYWPEIYTNLGLIDGSGRRAYAFDMEGPVRFGNAPTFDSALFATAREYAELLLAGKTCHRYTPLDVADWLEDMAEGCETALTRARSAADFGRPEVQRITADVQILGGIARYFAERFRAACWAELFVATQGLGADRARDRPRPPRGPRLGGDRRGVARPLPRRHHLRAAELAARLLALAAARDAGRAPRPRVAARLRQDRVGASPTPPPPPRRGAARAAGRPSPAAAAPRDRRPLRRRASRCAVRLAAWPMPTPIAALPARQPGRALALDGDARGTATATPPKSRPTTRSRDFHLQLLHQPRPRRGQVGDGAGPRRSNLANEPYVTVLQE